MKRPAPSLFTLLAEDLGQPIITKPAEAKHMPMPSLFDQEHEEKEEEQDD